MLTRGDLIELALGKDEARKVDTAIPQPVFDSMTVAARDDIAGWYYAPEVKIFGRLLTQSECWRQIMHKLKEGKLRATGLGFVGTKYEEAINLAPMVSLWPCLRQHVERGEIVLYEAVSELDARRI